MRIVIDMQGAQSLAARNRGVGRYTLSIVKSMIRHCGEHEILLVLNNVFADTILPLREAFKDLLARENIRVWQAAAPVAYINDVNDWRRRASEVLYEGFLASLEPDCVYVTSLFEGMVDDSVVAIHGTTHSFPVAVTLYDLIPWLYPDPYLKNPKVKSWYMEKITHLRRADAWLAISESSRREAIEHLGFSDALTINVSTDADERFLPVEISEENKRCIRNQYQLQGDFVMYTGGIDHRKNVEGLIRAYALLPQALRQRYQLAIVCSIEEQSRNNLLRLASKHGLKAGEVIFTGFVPDDDLLALYSLCALFVFPSWHEGFGLPVLEAMRCGAPVIGSNTSSIPEVLGWEDALFDPRSDESIAAYMQRGLTDQVYRQELILRAKDQARKFSWDETGRRAIDALVRMREKWLAELPMPSADKRLRLAYVSLLPPCRTGIADYSAELLPELSRYYDIDVIVDPSVLDDVQSAAVTVHTPEWLVDHQDDYDRVLYHFGNSSFHRYMFPLLDAVPGVVVLHDFFLSGVIAEMDLQGFRRGCWSRALYEGHGYAGLRERHQKADMADVVWEYPCSLGVIQHSLGLIVHSENSVRLASRWYGGLPTDWAVIPHMRDARITYSKQSARTELGLGERDFLVCAFGLLGPTKLNDRLLQAWANSSLAQDPTCHLVFVGENHTGVYGREIQAQIRAMGAKSNVRITGWADVKVFRQYLAAADVGIQLRTLSRGETSGTVLDCMNYGIATIVNANGSMADLNADAVWKLPDVFTDEQLTDALETLRKDEVLRLRMGEMARRIILTRHAPDKCAQQYHAAIEKFYVRAPSHLGVIAQGIACHAGTADQEQLRKMALAMGRSIVSPHGRPQLLVDISELVQRDVKSGIQRVVRSLLKEWLEHPPAGFRVEPVYATKVRTYHYARRFTMNLMDFQDTSIQDAPIDYVQGDIFIALDFQPEIVRAQRDFFQELRAQGVQVKFVVYDLLCLLQPQYFVPGAAEGFTGWLNVVLENDGAFCISQSVAQELKSWISAHAPTRAADFQVDWFHLGADIENSLASTGLPMDAEEVLDKLQTRPSFLMVGTVEPRKRHAYVLEAFETLWRDGQDINLVIVGKQGWMVEALTDQLRSHVERGHRLFWLENITDEYLEKIYSSSDCLIAASEGEGFGLPLIEAAQHKKHIIARDIPVFREVAQDHAFFFSGDASEDLSAAIESWLCLYQREEVQGSENMPWLTWKQSAELFKEKLFSAS